MCLRLMLTVLTWLASSLMPTEDTEERSGLVYQSDTGFITLLILLKYNCS